MPAPPATSPPATSPQSALCQGRHIRVRGAVQGVGFRPHVWHIARDLGLTGHVCNDGEGVLITTWGPPAMLDTLAQQLMAKAPPLARIDAIEITPAAGPPPDGFMIIASPGGGSHTAISPDAATCTACLADIHSPDGRRYGHAFANCTHCGPRMSILAAIPYDRANTTMAPFALCPACAAEYANPADRRFHAQPTCCPACGPRLWIEPAPTEYGESGRDIGPIAEAARRLMAGQILAIKGLGGFHLACDARNPAAVTMLRLRKQRDAKPFALMARDLAEIAHYCPISAGAEAALCSPAAPILLLPRRTDAPPLPEALAPDQDHLGFMLPATPLHHLLMAQMTGPLVMTSGNRSDAPPSIDNDAARTALAGIADGWLMHDRAILNRLDDSVLTFAGQTPVMIRRARGYAPQPIRLHGDFRHLPPTLAMGGTLKATVCLLRDGEAVLSQHIGDLAEAEAFDDYRAMLDLYRRLYDFTPDVIAVDAHADYLSTQAGEAMARASGAHLVRVAHHHAHMAACLAENGIGPLEGKQALGLVLDGLGLGPDGTFWGGELLAGGYHTGSRSGYLAPVALPGGHAAMREPWRNLLAHLIVAFGPEWRVAAGPVPPFWPDATRLALAEAMINTTTNSPLCSSAGRWFDAVAAMLGLHAWRISYEGQAAMALEALARPFVAEATPYPVAIDGHILRWGPFWPAMLADLAAGVPRGRIAARAHLTLIDGLMRLVDQAGGAGRHVALSGGVMQNRIILAGLKDGLASLGARPLWHRHVPANDGGISLGQAVIAGFAMSEREDVNEFA